MHAKVSTTPGWLRFALSAAVACSTALVPAPGNPVTVGSAGAPADPSSRATESLGYQPPGYTYSVWLNGWRKASANQPPAVFALTTSSYDFSLDLADFRHAGFAWGGPRAASYAEAVTASVGPLRHLPPTELVIELAQGGKVYRAVSSKAGTDDGDRRLSFTRLWESGRFAQHYDFLDLKFTDPTGTVLACNGKLDLVAWPNSLTLTATLSPESAYADGTDSPGVSGRSLTVITKPVDFPHSPALDPENLTVELWVNVPAQFAETSGWLLCKNSHENTQGNFGFKVSHGKVDAVLNLQGGHQAVVLPQNRNAFKLGEWNHLALTYDGNHFEFYVNGKSQGGKDLHAKRVPGQGALRLGGRADGTQGNVQAQFDNLRIWNRALKAKELAAHAAKPSELPVRDGLTFENTFDQAGAPPPTPSTATDWNNAAVRILLKYKGITCKAVKVVAGPWRAGTEQSVSLTLPAAIRPEEQTATTVAVTAWDKQSIPVQFDPQKNCWVASVSQLRRDPAGSYSDAARDYDEFAVTVNNQGFKGRDIPFLLDFRGPASITGLCPILCDPEGRPTGIPVQLSKNWHYDKMGTYLMAYTSLPSKPGKSSYLLRVAYGFYGTLPSASHAQLSLVGYGGHGRWDQLAIGSWGETICFDMDMSLTKVAVTDVRMLMARDGLEGKQWNWTDAGWGGDWLGMTNPAGEKLAFNELKTAYLSQGPCLTDVRHLGFYGTAREVTFGGQVQTLRTDDYARTFQNLNYTFNTAASTDDLWLYKLGGGGHYITPVVAYGNQTGLLAEKTVPADLVRGQLFLDKTTLTGSGPWWVAFPGSTSTDGRNWGTGYRALIIRSYRATWGGKTYTNPTLGLPVNEVDATGRGTNLDLLLVPPPEVTAIQPGDSVAMELELITLPRIADDYYGPNELLKKHLSNTPNSWKTTYREASGNDLEVTAVGGKVLRRYPVIIQAEAPTVEVRIKGGVGYVPIRFEGLKAGTGFELVEVVDGHAVPLDQAARGNDFWQTDYDEKTQSYRLTYNLALDNKPTSVWRLQPHR